MGRRIIYPKDPNCDPGMHEEVVYKPDIGLKAAIKLPNVGPIKDSSIEGTVYQRGSQTKICVPDNPSPPFQAPPAEQLSDQALENAVRNAQLNVEDALMRMDSADKALEECNQKLEEEMAKQGETSRRERTLACGFSEGDPLPCPYCGRIHVNAFLDRCGPGLGPQKQTDCSAQWQAYAEAEQAYQVAHHWFSYLLDLLGERKNVHFSNEVSAGRPELEGGAPRLRGPYWRRSVP
jgi:hypothetical protein